MSDVVTEARLPARIGALLGSPGRALADLDRLGGGVRDAVWVSVVCTVCLSLPELARAFLGWQVAPLAVLRQVLMVVARGLREPVVLALVAGVAITVLAGRGKRDPGKDIDLGAACVVPFMVVATLLGTIELLVPVPGAVNQVVRGLGMLWSLVLVARAVALARRRGGEQPALPAGNLRDRLAVTGLAAVLGLAVTLNAVEIARSSRVAPNFTLNKVDGSGAVSLADLRGKVVLLDFWATWCRPCTEMAKPLRELYTEFQPRGVEFVGINQDGPGVTTEEVLAHLKSHPAPYPIVMDDGQVGGRYNVMALPHMVVLDREGAIRKIFLGVTSRGELAAALRRYTGPD